MTDTLKLIQEKEDELSSLFERMDDDKELHLQAKYIMRFENGKPIPDVHNVTLPHAPIFANRVINLLSSADQQPVIEGDKLDDKFTTGIEDFLNDVEYENDIWLTKRGMPGMAPVQWERVCLRGHPAPGKRYRQDHVRCL